MEMEGRFETVTLENGERCNVYYPSETCRFGWIIEGKGNYSPTTEDDEKISAAKNAAEIKEFFGTSSFRDGFKKKFDEAIEKTVNKRIAEYDEIFSEYCKSISILTEEKDDLIGTIHTLEEKIKALQAENASLRVGNNGLLKVVSLIYDYMLSTSGDQVKISLAGKEITVQVDITPQRAIIRKK